MGCVSEMFNDLPDKIQLKLLDDIITLEKKSEPLHWYEGRYVIKDMSQKEINDLYQYYVKKTILALNDTESIVVKGIFKNVCGNSHDEPYQDEYMTFDGDEYGQDYGWWGEAPKCVYSGELTEEALDSYRYLISGKVVLELSGIDCIVKIYPGTPFGEETDEGIICKLELKLSDV